MSIIGELLGLPAEHWMVGAPCAETDPEAYFPEKGGTTRDAKRVCGGCDIRSRCLQYALDRDERFGVWGGLSERERRRLKRGEVVPFNIPDQQKAKPCVTCGTHFVASMNALYCGRPCRVKAQAARHRQRKRDQRRAA